MTSEFRDLREQLLFETAPGAFAETTADLRAAFVDEFGAASSQRRAEIVELIGELAIDLSSYLPRWHLLATSDSASLDAGMLHAETDRMCDLLKGWGAEQKAAEVEAEIASLERSNLRRLSEMADRGEIDSRWGHDAATGLTWAVRRGAVLATTNPVMVNGVRKEDPATWDPVRDALRADYPDRTAEQRVSLMTMNVALDGCRELRPIWRATDGRYGYVSLQVNPRASDDAVSMAEEVEELYGHLGRELGGTPNTRFKIPGTRAGLEAVRRLTSKGIAVTVTVNASVDQHLAFAEVIEQGSAPLSFVVLMMGRLDDPVREELAAKGVSQADEVSRWASIAVLRRSYQLLFEERGYQRSAIMAASMRGPWTIEGSIADGASETFITCFPGKAREFDAVPRDIVSRVHEPVPQHILDRLSQSATFHQAYEVGALSVEGFDGFTPVVQTLKQFAQNYDEFVEYNR